MCRFFLPLAPVLFCVVGAAACEAALPKKISASRALVKVPRQAVRLVDNLRDATIMADRKGQSGHTNWDALDAIIASLLNPAAMDLIEQANSHGLSYCRFADRASKLIFPYESPESEVIVTTSVTEGSEVSGAPPAEHSVQRDLSTIRDSAPAAECTPKAEEIASRPEPHQDRIESRPTSKEINQRLFKICAGGVVFFSVLGVFYALLTGRQKPA